MTDMNALHDTNVLDGSPTKEFFIHMLTRDVPLARAIIDLIDNSVDGARRSAEGDNLSQYWVHVDLSNERFRIVDNCGGILVERAQQYAFKFGRPSAAGSEPGSIGQFGVGMKRTVFKLGGRFKVESRTSNSYFIVEEVVNDWLARVRLGENSQKVEDWNFRFSTVVRDAQQESEPGTTIEVTDLHESVAAAFSQENFRSALIKDIKAAHVLAIRDGLTISVNGLPVAFELPEFASSEQIRPAFWEHSYDLEPSPVRARIYAGVAEQRKYEGGWYVFCNGRMVLAADQSLITGWGEGDGKIIPRYHTDYAFFRGFVFLTSDAPALLPWTTTKTGVDTDSAVYQAVRLEMIRIMGPVISFLRKLATERAEVSAEHAESSPLREALEQAKPVSHTAVTEVRSFTAPAAQIVRTQPTTRRIQYDRGIAQIDAVKRQLNVRTLREVGERTFDYYMEMECE